MQLFHPLRWILCGKWIVNFYEITGRGYFGIDTIILQEKAVPGIMGRKGQDEMIPAGGSDNRGVGTVPKRFYVNGFFVWKRRGFPFQ